MVNPRFAYTNIRGRHTLKTGFEYQGVQFENQPGNSPYGRDTYAGRFTRPANGNAANAIYNLGDFLLGARSRYALGSVFTVQVRQRMYFSYIQDDWQISRRLTLNLGLRYEYATPAWERDNLLSNFDPATLTIAQARNGSLENRALVRPDRNNLGPRTGLAIRLDDKTAIRSGYGISHVHFNRGSGLLAINGPHLVTVTVDQTDPRAASFLRTEQGYPEGLADPAKFSPLTATVAAYPRDNPSAYVQSWFFSLQREILPKTVLDLAYVGNRSLKLPILADYNQARPNRAGERLGVQQRRPLFPDCGRVSMNSKWRPSTKEEPAGWHA